MKLGKHTKTESGRFRQERIDSKIGNLKKEYVQLASVNGNKKLGTLLEELNVPSLSQALKKLGKK